MPIEIERKFLLKNDTWKSEADNGTQFVQGYLVGSKKSSVRIRIEGDNAFINIKSATLDITRKEYQYEIPVSEARELLKTLCEPPLIDKTRYIVNKGSHKWEIDVFAGDNDGLIVAEIELNHENEQFDKPDWIGKEVSEQQRYYNVCLVKHPYKDWQTKDEP